MKPLANTWDIIPTEKFQTDEFVDDYGLTINNITKDAFKGVVSFESHELEASLPKSTHVGLARNDGGEVVGFCLVRLFEERLLQGKSVIWINKIAVAQTAQGHGLGVKRLTAKLKELPTKTTLGWVGCCTQSNSLIKGLSSIAESYYPLRTPYGSASGIGPWTYLTMNVNQVQERIAEKYLDLDSSLFSDYGIIKNGFSKRINVSEVEISTEMDSLLRSWGFNQLNGDLLILLAKLN